MLNTKNVRRNIAIDIAVILIVSVVLYIISLKYDLLESLYRFSRQHENLEIDEIFAVVAFLSLALMYFSLRRLVEVYEAHKQLSVENRELQKALDEIKTLRGIIPICSLCKKIRSDSDSWKQLESYISEHSYAKFSHGLCPECYKKQIDDLKD